MDYVSNIHLWNPDENCSFKCSPTWILWSDTLCRCYTWPGAWRSRRRPRGAGRVATPWTEALDASSPGTWQLPVLVCCWPAEEKMKVRWAQVKVKQKKRDTGELFLQLIFLVRRWNQIFVWRSVFTEKKNSKNCFTGSWGAKYFMSLDIFGCEVVKKKIIKRPWMICWGKTVWWKRTGKFYFESGSKTFFYKSIQPCWLRHVHFHNFILGYNKNKFTCFNAEKTHQLSHNVQCFVGNNLSLTGIPSLLWLVSSNMPEPERDTCSKSIITCQISC